MTQRFSCARDAAARGEALYGTASQVRRWVLLEQDGPWGRDAVLESRLDVTVAKALQARTRQLGARLVLIRRHGRREPGPWRAYVAVSAQGRSWAEELSLDQPAALLDVDISALGDDASVGGRRLDDPLYLVCTNGRHDACCAEYGRPLARALSAARPAGTWECSHIGGDRFAGNLVCLPEGVYYGQVTDVEAAGVASAHAGGRLVLDRYRGRSCYPFVVQAAEYFLRRRLGLDGIDDVAATHLRRGGADGVHAVTLRSAAGQYTVEVAVTSGAREQRLTCQSARPSSPPRYELLSWTAEA